MPLAIEPRKGVLLSDLGQQNEAGSQVTGAVIDALPTSPSLACPRHDRPGQEAGPHAAGKSAVCGCCVGTCQICSGDSQHPNLYAQSTEAQQQQRSPELPDVPQAAHTLTGRPDRSDLHQGTAEAGEGTIDDDQIRPAWPSVLQATMDGEVAATIWRSLWGTDGPVRTTASFHGPTLTSTR